MLESWGKEGVRLRRMHGRRKARRKRREEDKWRKNGNRNVYECARADVCVCLVRVTMYFISLHKRGEERSDRRLDVRL